MTQGKGRNAITEVDDHPVRGKTHITQGKNVQFTFVEDANGEIWSGYEIQELTSMLRGIFEELEN